MNRKPPRERARAFLQVARLYRLGGLPTEQPHPLTRDLSGWARSDLPRALAVLKRIDLEALHTLETYAGRIDQVSQRVRATLDRGRRVFLCGCGATGRLALSLESLWRQRGHERDRVSSFMAGGDVALVHALEGFEDHPRLGARHLLEMGFSNGDLLISCTEGGETPYVIGATEKAAEISDNAPCFLYCNGDAVLNRNVERFRRVYENPSILNICLDVGPMALTGSTRMQASTVLQLAVGLALLHPERSAGVSIAEFRRQVRAADFCWLADFVSAESEVYSSGDHVIYRVGDYGITVLTDTTERAPTFSLVPFDRASDRRERYSLCYVSLNDAATPVDAWTRLLGRPTRPLDWPEVDPRATPGYLHGFDFSAGAPQRRRHKIPDKAHHEFHIRRTDRGIAFRLGHLAHEVAVNGTPDLFQHLLLKQLLNAHSTLVMGRLGRFESNLMTWVSPTNGKLIDRAARYVRHLLRNRGQGDHSYENIVHRLFVEMDRTPPGESVVLRTFRSLSRDKARRARPTPRPGVRPRPSPPGPDRS